MHKDGPSPVTLNNEAHFKFSAFLAPVKYLYQDQSIQVPEFLPNTIIRTDNGIEVFTDLFKSKNYSGRFQGSSRHCLLDQMMIKGIGPNPLCQMNDVKHRDGVLSFEEMVQEFAVFQTIKDYHLTPKILAVGRYQENNQYFLIREHIYPRLAQYDKTTAHLIGFQSINDFNPVRTILENLITPLGLGIHHLSLNSANVNILGQYLDLASFGLIVKNEQKIYFTPDGENTLSLIKRLTIEALDVWGSILKKDFSLFDEKDTVSALLTKNFGEVNIEKVTMLFWNEKQIDKNDHCTILIPEDRIIQSKIVMNLKVWKHLLAHE